MYYLAKIFQAAGLTVLLIGFMANFPRLMSRMTLVLGLVLFGFGWIIQRYVVRGRRP